MSKQKPRMIAHRGWSARYPDNTEPAFIMAAQNGSAGAETDIRKTADGVYVASHDPDAVFADGTRLTVADNTFAALTAKPLRNTKSDDVVYLCTFRRYLEIMREHDMICFVELKGDFTTDEIREIFTLVQEVYALQKCILQSFSFENLLRVRDLFPDLPLMLTFGSCETGMERCFDHGISLDIEYTIVTPEIIRQFHDLGLEVALWTVNDEDALQACLALGVDYIESDVFGGQ